ncbi:MAG: DUF5615 family PIN-like protein [Tepidiformaceae bacterium]
MPLRLYLDHDSSDRAVVTALRAAGVDVLTSAEAHRNRAPDEEQLTFATAEGRCVYTANCQDFAALHSRWMQTGRAHGGMILRADQRLPVGPQVRALLAIHDAFQRRPTENLFEYLEIWVPRSSSAQP